MCWNFFFLCVFSLLFRLGNYIILYFSSLILSSVLSFLLLSQSANSYFSFQSLYFSAQQFPFSFSLCALLPPETFCFPVKPFCSFILFFVLINSSLKQSILTALKSSSDHSNISHWLSFFIQFKISLVLGMTTDFLFVTRTLTYFMMKVWILFKPPMLSSILWYHCGRAEGCHLVTARWRQKSRFPLRLHYHLKVVSSVSLLDGGRSSRLPLPTCSSLTLWWGLLLTTGQWWKCSLSTPLTSPPREGAEHLVTVWG